MPRFVFLPGKRTFAKPLPLPTRSERVMLKVPPRRSDLQNLNERNRNIGRDFIPIPKVNSK